MPTSAAALQILLILLPGFAAAYGVQLLAVRAKQTDLEKVIEALLFSFVIYVTYYPLNHGHSPVIFVHSPTSDSIDFHPGNLVWLGVITLIYIVLMVVFVNKDGTLLLRRMGLTERTSRSSICNDVFQGVEDPVMDTTVQVELADGRSVQEFVLFYSDSAEECSIFLSDARWIGENPDEIIPIPGPGILLTKNANIVSVSFLDPVEEPAST